MMQHLGRMSFFILFGCSLMVFAHSAHQHDKAFRNFWNPTFHGERLDYCSKDGVECGKPVADRYCQTMGYDESNRSLIAYNVGLTHFIASREECRGWRCNGFISIDCTMRFSHKPPAPYHYRAKKFAYPRYNNYRVDWCYVHDKGCGSRAANAFCRHEGYLSATHFSKQKRIGATKTIGSHELCFGNQCTAFQLIICSR